MQWQTHARSSTNCFFLDKCLFPVPADPRWGKRGNDVALPLFTRPWCHYEDSSFMTIFNPEWSSKPPDMATWGPIWTSGIIHSIQELLHSHCLCGHIMAGGQWPLLLFCLSIHTVLYDRMWARFLVVIPIRIFVWSLNPALIRTENFPFFVSLVLLPSLSDLFVSFQIHS